MAGKAKRVLFIQTQAENAGAQEISRLLGQGLSARGHEIHHLFFYRKTDGFDDNKNTIICCDERPGSPLAFLRFFKGLVGTIKKINPDIVFTFQHFGNVLGAPACRVANAPNIIANQVSARETINPILRMLDLMWGMSPLYRHITINSEVLLRDYENFPALYTRKLLQIPHGFEDKTASISKQQAREMHDLPLDAPLLGTVARLNEAKQIDCAIELLTRDPKWHLVIAGQGPDGERLKSIAAKLGVDKRITFLGELAQDQIGSILAALDVFVFPSRAETFGLAAVEAAQAGIPVVANDLDVLREVLDTKGEPCAELIDVRDGEAFANAVRRLLEDEGHAQEMIERGLRLKDKYSLDAMVDAYEAMVLNKDLDPWEVSKAIS